MASAKIYAPNPAAKGVVAGVTFEEGVGEYDPKKNPAAARYFERHGYRTRAAAASGSEPAEAAPLNALEAEASPDGTDARDFGEPIAIGTKLRDAAVDPEPEDFLAPVNAGSADPHGPNVVAPEIHHPGAKGIKPGDVHVGEPAEQEAAEKALAESVLIDGEEHPTAGEDADRGPLELSDPGSVEMGIEGAKENAAAEAANAPEAPPKVATKRAPRKRAPRKRAASKKGA